MGSEGRGIDGRPRGLEGDFAEWDDRRDEVHGPGI
jgi:hypothetical protein